MINVVYISHENSATNLLGSSLSLNNLLHSVKEECKIYVVTPNRGKSYQFFKDQGYECISVPFQKDTISTKSDLRNAVVFIPKLLKYLILNIYSLLRLAVYFHGKNIQIVHSNTSVIDVGYYLAKILHAKHVWHIREFQNIENGLGLKPFMGWNRLRRLIYKSDYSISITDAIARHYGLLGKPNSKVLGDAVRKGSEVLNEWPKEKFFLFCGHVCPAKGADWAVKAFSLFCHTIETKFEGYKLLMCGQCSDEYQKELLAIDPDINDRIKFLGYQNSVANYFRKAMAFLMCSANEGLGRVTIEAMFYGCPVIGRNTAGTKTLLGEGRYGFPFDTIEQCAKIMHNVANDAALSKNKVDAAQKFVVSTFSEEVYGQKILSIYQKILRSKQ